MAFKALISIGICFIYCSTLVFSTRAPEALEICLEAIYVCLGVINQGAIASKSCVFENGLLR